MSRNRSAALAAAGRRFGLVLALVSLALPGAAQAHLMLAQRGTLHVVGDGAYLVLSVPASALPEADDDRDGLLSLAELRAHQADVSAKATAQLQLLEGRAPRALEGVMLSLSPPDHATGKPGAQVVVLGRFPLRGPPSAPLRLRVGLWGERADERAFDVLVTRQGEQQLAHLTATRPDVPLLLTSSAVFLGATRLGIEHILGGLDHLLFLLLVLAASGSVRHAIAALSCFTMGHATTLGLSIGLGVAAPDRLVEPCIAATLVAMAALDARSAAKGAAPAPRRRLALVFGCALIHGLGLSSSLREAGLGSDHLALVVGGFNLGVEVGQVGVAAAAAVGVAAASRALGWGSYAGAQRLARWGSAFAGAVWFVQRVMA